MIIQCEQCQTKYKFDDSKVADKSIKVRCARCRNVFSVARMQPAAPDDSDFFWQDEAALPAGAEQEFETPLLESAVVVEPETPPQDVAPQPSGFLEHDDFAFAEEPAAPPSTATVSDDDDFSFPSADSTVVDVPASTPVTHDDLDFGEFDFDDTGGDASKSAAAAPAIDFDDIPLEQPAEATPSTKEFGGLDFTGDDLFGEVAGTASEEESKEPISFDVGMDGFADSMGVDGTPSGQDMSLSSQDQSAENPFSLDDIDFGDELTSVAVQQVSTEELKPGQDLLFAPLAKNEPQPAPDKAQAPAATAAAAQDDLPPLSIASRRKESPRISGMLLLLGAMIAGLVVFYTYWGFVTLTEEKTVTPQEAGRITLRQVEAIYVKNKKLGNLLVISGEAVNEYSKPRAAIQVRGIVFGADGKEMVSKSAFCGNPLSEEQLATMTMDKFEAAMANQFGDSLANMEVFAGAAIPFVIVIPQPAAGAKDYGVEPVGSTVATAKEK